MRLRQFTSAYHGFYAVAICAVTLTTLLLFLSCVELRKAGGIPDMPQSGYYEKPLSFTIPYGKDGAIIVCDTSGAPPSQNSKLRSGTRINFTETSVMRCISTQYGIQPKTPIMRTYFIGRLPDLPVVSIAVDPSQMFDSKSGLYSKGPNANSARPHYGANYWSSKELGVQIEFFEHAAAGSAWTHQTGLRIFGNWSRMYDKKSVLITFRKKYGKSKLAYPLFPDHPELTRFNHFVLRNNGNNFKQDYIRDMLMTSLTEGLGIDYQRGRAVVVYYNGEYFGIHNLRERANADYFKTKYGISQDSVDLIKADRSVSAGSGMDYNDIMRWLESMNGLNDENLKLLEQRIDIDNFTYNWMCRMYYHDRDWPRNNMKIWRSHSPDSRWKWFMYDTDHGWGSHSQRKLPDVSTMEYVTAANSKEWSNAPLSTLLFRRLLENESYKNSFINRFSLIMATYFVPDRVNARIDELMAPIQTEIKYDQERWQHDVSRMNRELHIIRTFSDSRNPQMQGELESYFGLDGWANLTLSAQTGGKVFVHNMEVLNDSASFRVYQSIPVSIKAVPNSGAVFDRWSDGKTEPYRVIDVMEGESVSFSAIFKETNGG